MIKRFQNVVYGMLGRKSFEGDNGLYLYLLMYIATGFAALIHVGLAVLFAVSAMPLMLYVNLGSIAVYALTFFFLKKRQYGRAGLLISLEVGLYSFAFIFLSNDETYTILYFLILLIMQMIIPYSTMRVRGTVIAVTWVAVIASCYLKAAPLVLDVGPIAPFLRVANLNVTIIGAVVELSVGNFTKSVVARYNDRQINELKDQAYTDTLTGLFNRRYADLIFEKISKGESLAPARWCVAMVDIDDFKRINDKLGHGVGDEVLRSVAERIRQHLRRTDLVFRWGGEEFLILLGNVDVSTAFSVVEKLRASFSLEPVMAGRRPLGITVTIGVAPLDPEDIEGSIEKSDQNLYVGKHSGKNKVVM